MEEEVNQKVVSLCVRSARFTGTELAKLLKMFLEAQKQKSNQYARGKQSLKELTGQNAGVTSIEISDKNIKTFERVARKYGIDFALKKDKSCKPPKYYVFFKGRDMDAMTMAFKEYVASNNRKRKAPGIKKMLEHFKVKSQEHSRQNEKTKIRERGGSL
ncbi:MAG: PcfB family protein [Lachnospiraceae bacterium]|nr:PcfB family protein [Lachnospiraceae bacterium]